MKKLLSVFVFMFTLGLFHTGFANESFNVTCTVTDDQDGDTSIVKEPFVIEKNNSQNTESNGDGTREVPKDNPKSHWSKNFTTKALPNSSLSISLSHSSEDGGLFYLSLMDNDRKAMAQTVGRQPENMYVFLAVEDNLGVIGQCKKTPATKK